jgi:hypothetical protein
VINFICAVNIDWDGIDVVEVEDFDAVPFETLAGCFRAGYRTQISAFQRGEGVDEKLAVEPVPTPIMLPSGALTAT